MKKIILFTFIFFIAFGASAQLADNASDVPSFRSYKKALKIFPNPATEYFQLTDRNDSVDQINIYNIVGKKMRTFEVEDDKKYYLNQFPKGMYLIQLVDHNNKIISTQRLNVKKP